MKKLMILMVSLLMCGGAAIGQENEVKRIPTTTNKSKAPKALTDYEQGIYFAAEATGGYTLRLDKSNMPFGEVDVTVGWRFNEHLKAGIGFGGRYFINNNCDIRRYHERWDFPIYVNVRGNLVPETYRTVVPYYSVDMGVAVRDGFMIRPTVGLRFGEPRSAFLLGISYVGQDYRSWGSRQASDGTPECYKKNRFVSGIAIRLGYEF